MSGLGFYRAIDLVVYEEIDVLCFVGVGYEYLFSFGLEVDDLIGEVVVVGEGEFKLFYSCLHFCDVDEALVEIDIDV